MANMQIFPLRTSDLAKVLGLLAHSADSADEHHVSLILL